jgi:hypothetical protein
VLTNQNETTSGAWQKRRGRAARSTQESWLAGGIMRKRTALAAAAVLAAGALLRWLAASGRLAVAQDKPGQPNAATQPPASDAERRIAFLTAVVSCLRKERIMAQKTSATRQRTFAPPGAARSGDRATTGVSKTRIGSSTASVAKANPWPV